MSLRWCSSALMNRKHQSDCLKLADYYLLWLPIDFKTDLNTCDSVLYAWAQQTRLWLVTIKTVHRNRGTSNQHLIINHRSCNHDYVFDELYDSNLCCVLLQWEFEFKEIYRMCISSFLIVVVKWFMPVCHVQINSTLCCINQLVT